MDKRIEAALADELLNTVIHRFQIPGSGVQVKVQAMAIKELVDILEKNSSTKFPDLDALIDQVASEMPACYGGVPSSFYELRRTIEDVLSQDEFLKHIVNVHAIRGSREDLYTLLPLLKDPDVPEAFKEKMMEGSIMFIPDSSTLESVKALVVEMGGENSNKMLAQIAPYAEAAKQGDELKEATAEGIAGDNWEKLRNAEIDNVEMMEVSAQADAVLDLLFRHYLSKFYTKSI